MGFDDDQLSLAEAAALLGLAPSSLNLQARRGTLQARKIGKTWVTTRAEVERYRRDHLGRTQLVWAGKAEHFRGNEAIRILDLP